jgi:hypothetical protein
MSLTPARASLAGIMLTAALGAAALLPGRALAVPGPCAAGLTVAGQPVTGSECETNGDGSTTITNPKFGASGAVTIVAISPAPTAKMVLNAARSAMVPENVAIPLQLSVGDKGVLFGNISVGNNELCDVEAATADPPATVSDVPPNPDAAGAGARVQDTAGKTAAAVFTPGAVNCRTIPSFKLDFSNFNELGKLAGLDVGKLSAKLPTVAGFDDTKGGRVFTTVPIKLPKPFDQEVDEGGAKKKVPTFIGVAVEMSAAEGFKALPTGFRINKSIPLGPLSVDQLNGVFDPNTDRVGGGFLLRLPGNKALGAQVALQNGEIQKLGADIALPAPVPLFGPVSATSIGGTFTAGTTTSTTGPRGVTNTTPSAFQGRMKFIIKPGFGGSNTPLNGDVSLTVSKPSYKLAGNLFTSFGSKQVKLGDAKILLVTSPFRFELEANANIFEVIKAHGFLGIGDGHVTLLGDASVVVPKDIKFIGGQTLGGFSLAASEVGAGAVITIDPPLVKPFALGLGTKFSPFKLKIISSIDEFITIRPSSRSAGAARAAGVPVALAAAQKTVKLPKGLDQVSVSITGSRRVPRAVKLSVKGKRLVFGKVGSGGNGVQYVLSKPPAGTLTVSSRDAIKEIAVGRIREFPYLDPSPGFGSQPKGPVTAGQPAKVCWKIKNAPKGAVVDLFEDQNGNSGSGRSVAVGRPANGCFDVPTAGLEPGRHWVYGVVRVGAQPIDQRYWPIPLTIVDPAALPAPTAVTAIPTADGATVAWSPVANADGYVVRAEPVDEYAGEPVEQSVGGAELSAELSLRGAKDWNVSVQAISQANARGNLSDPIRVTPTDPVVLEGTPNGAAEVGKPWAFQVRTVPGVALKLVSGPRGMSLSGGIAQLRWTPAKAAGASQPAQFVVEGCKADRCVRRTFNVSAYGKGYAPFGPPRGFAVGPNVVKPGQVVTIRAQGIDAKPVVKVDGKPVKVVRVNAGALEFKAPKLAKGAHDVTLKIGSDLEERKPGALVVQ